MLISNFILNREKKIEILQKDLVNFITKLIKTKNYQNFLIKLTKYLNIKTSTLEQETKIFLFSKFLNKKGRFKKIFNIVFLPISVVNFLLIVFYIKFFEKTSKPKQIYRYDILIDGLDRNNILRKYNNLVKKKNVLFVIYDKKKYFKEHRNTYYFNYRKIYLEDKKRLNTYVLFYLLIISFYLSLKSGNNIIPILTNFLKKYYKYNSLFYSRRSNFILQERFYSSSAIKDEIFHNYKGKLSCLLQKNIFQMNGPGMFVNADVLFTLGKKSYPNLKKFGCKIKKFVAVGSLFMESDYFKHPNYVSRNKSKRFYYDMLVFASSHTREFHSGYNSYYKEYYEHFEWIKRLAIKFPKIKIAIKHKKNFNDDHEVAIFKDIKNVKYIVDKSKNYSDSYIFAFKSKSLFTWSSTLGFELMSLKKNCFFIDPKNSNHSFLPDSKINNLVRISNFKKLESTFKKQLKNSKVKFIKNYDNYCLNSSRTSKNIINYLENH